MADADKYEVDLAYFELKIPLLLKEGEDVGKSISTIRDGLCLLCGSYRTYVSGTDERKVEMLRLTKAGWKNVRLDGVEICADGILPSGLKHTGIEYRISIDDERIVKKGLKPFNLCFGKHESMWQFFCVFDGGRTETLDKMGWAYFPIIMDALPKFLDEYQKFLTAQKNELSVYSSIISRQINTWKMKG